MVKGNPSQGRKRVDAVDSRAASVLVRAKDGSAFARWYSIPSLSLPVSVSFHLTNRIS